MHNVGDRVRYRDHPYRDGTVEAVINPAKGLRAYRVRFDDGMALDVWAIEIESEAAAQERERQPKRFVTFEGYVLTEDQYTPYQNQAAPGSGPHLHYERKMGE